MRFLKRFLLGRRAYAMPFYAIVLSTVALPLLMLPVKRPPRRWICHTFARPAKAGST